MHEALLHIDGRSIPAEDGRAMEVLSPVTGEPVALIAHATAADVNLAVAAARRTFQEKRWRGIPPRERARVLNRAATLLAEHVDDYATLETLQIGRPIREMRAQLARLPEWLEYFGAVAQTDRGSVPHVGSGHVNLIRRVPLGVAGLITSWNHPLLITMKKLSVAIAAGNSVVIKPSELGPLVPLRLAELLEEAGLPAGVVNVITGAGATTGKALSEHPGIDKLDVTGTETGRLIAAEAGRRLIPVTAELGGKAPVIVFDDSPIDEAVSGALFASFVATGQTCVQGSRILVQSSVYSTFLERFLARVDQLRLGDPADAETQIGPLISAAQRDRVAEAVDKARAQGVCVAAGGRPPSSSGLTKGNFYSPTVLTEVTTDHDVWREEVFGPVAIVTSFTDEEDAVRLANDADFGLAGSVWTTDIARAFHVVDRLDIGIVWINDHHRVDPASPWGGMKDSGIGSENAIEAYHTYTQMKSTVVNTARIGSDWFGTTAPMRYS